VESGTIESGTLGSGPVEPAAAAEPAPTSGTDAGVEQVGRPRLVGITGDAAGAPRRRRTR
ncbi:MAG TPA: hypothetical protein VII33_04240, partial [Nakamurella sp.]